MHGGRFHYTARKLRKRAVSPQRGLPLLWRSAHKGIRGVVRFAHRPWADACPESCARLKREWCAGFPGGYTLWKSWELKREFRVKQCEETADCLLRAHAGVFPSCPGRRNQHGQEPEATRDGRRGAAQRQGNHANRAI